MKRARKVRPAAAAAIALIGLAAAGCSSSASSSSPPTATATTTVTATASAPASSSTAVPPSSPAGGGAAACPTSSLQVKQTAPDGYAGGVYVTIVFTNAANSPCTLYGYPGVSLVSSSRTQLGLAAKRTTTTPVKLVTLASGASAHAQLQIVDALNFPALSCAPTKATYLRIFPPNQTAAVYLSNASSTCSKPTQTLFISPVQAGAGSSS
ncbi:MAG: DUF4232 domain-containing protein [Streptosporangiaceae bacterium]